MKLHVFISGGRTLFGRAEAVCNPFYCPEVGRALVEIAAGATTCVPELTDELARAAGGLYNSR